MTPLRVTPFLGAHVVHPLLPRFVPRPGLAGTLPRGTV